jgi:hypothetical protein
MANRKKTPASSRIRDETPALRHRWPGSSSLSRSFVSGRKRVGVGTIVVVLCEAAELAYSPTRPEAV